MTSSSRTLVVAPYVGEFGWELMNWQGRMRWVMANGRYERVILVARPDRCEMYLRSVGHSSVAFRSCDELQLLGHANEDHRVDSEGTTVPVELLIASVRAATQLACGELVRDWDDTDILMPPFDSTMWPTSGRYQRFVSLRSQTAITTDVVLIPRTRTLADERNQPQSWWDDLAVRLRALGLRVETYVSNVDRAIRQLSGARLAIGASTGGLHLASLCECPHYVWGCGPEARWTRLGMTNRQRYETVWNPLGTPCRYDECGWQPSVEHVVRQTLLALKRIGLREGAASLERSKGAGWLMRRGLSRLMEPNSTNVLPWRLKRLIVKHMV
ncbi:MAG: hypothetical protein AABZ08_12070 [Planctomycetota bacterium]